MSTAAWISVAAGAWCAGTIGGALAALRVTARRVDRAKAQAGRVIGSYRRSYARLAELES